jgi:hypothetical protein
MTIVGVILSFRQLAQSALVDTLEERIPFLLSSVHDFKHHLPNSDPPMVMQRKKFNRSQIYSIFFVSDGASKTTGDFINHSTSFKSC